MLFRSMNVEMDETSVIKREKVKVYIDKNPVESWIYWYAGNTDNMQEIVTGDIMKYLQEKNKPNLQ